ncbi:MAG: hypothetical protein QF586_06930 [Arenicellales bacterium]|jgi:hypothetical protein|nr:hypothetical protein [Acidiferrobacteraceae bacterium]MDP6122325.1 hypothetical protein [Arenicellales bacterium]MDP6289940.1 hypothetical protein [Arenicellales bacterium]MDP6434729.1 hypothetical protein [Arenicellales bacterium]MDP6671452.1 hypothetical protein [Arenicellales bacterium]|tara:strand:- start:2662 stop:2865 length:204 start_codon:yes stop_codon:yes gene_type:complete
MSEKEELIKQMIEMQKKFSDYEHQDGVEAKDYFVPEAGHPLDGYRQQYAALARRVIDIAHEEKGTEI